MKRFSIPRGAAWRLPRLLACLLGLLAAPTAFAQLPFTVPDAPFWQWQNPLPQGYQLNDIQPFNDSTAILVGARGTLLKTTDRGLSWQRLPVGTTRDLLQVSFGSPQVGWVIYNTPGPDASDQEVETGHAEIRRTTDGGATWTVTILPSYRKTVRMLGVQALSASEAYVYFSSAATLGAYVYHTADGGTSWQLRSTLGYVFSGTLQFISSQRGYLATNDPSYVLKTVNGGLSWQPITPSATLNYRTVVFADSLHGWAAGYNTAYGSPNCYATQDNGRTWQAQNPNSFGNTITVDALAFASPTQGIATYNSGGRSRTQNGGAAWQTVGFRQGLRALRLLPSGVGWAVGDQGRMDYTTDFGATWISRTASVSGERAVVEVQFPDPTHGWALPDQFSQNQALLHTTRRGQPWQRVPLAGIAGVGGTDFALRNLAFPDADTGYVYVIDRNPLNVSQFRNTLLKTTNAGQDWTVQALPFAYNGSATFTSTLRFATTRRGVLVGSNGLICATQDGGQSWQLASSGTRRTLRNATWADAHTVYAVGDTLTLLKSQDGGQTWRSLALPPGASPLALRTLSFVSAQVGYVATYGEVFHTTDGGSTWQVLPLPRAKSVADLAFSTAQQGWLLTGNEVYHTTNAGQSWTSVARFGLDGVNAEGLASQVVRVDRYNAWTYHQTAILRYSERYIQADTTRSQPLAYCAGQALQLAFATEGSLSQVPADYRVQVSNKMGRFRPGETLTLTPTAASTARQLTVMLPASLPAGSRYRLRVLAADSSVLGGDNQRDLTLTPVPAAPVVTQPQAGGPLQVSQPVAGASYQWLLGGAAIAGATGPRYPASGTPGAGTYTVVATVGGCASPSSAPLAVVLATQAAAPTGFALYPNPAHGTATLAVPAQLLRQPVGVTLRNALGQTVCTLTVPPGSTDVLVPLTVAGLPAGLYLVQVNAAQGILARRLLVQ